MRAYIRTCVFLRACVCVCVCVYVCMYVRIMCVCVYLCFLYMYVCRCKYVFIYVFMSMFSTLSMLPKFNVVQVFRRKNNADE